MTVLSLLHIQAHTYGYMLTSAAGATGAAAGAAAGTTAAVATGGGVATGVAASNTAGFFIALTSFEGAWCAAPAVAAAGVGVAAGAAVFGGVAVVGAETNDNLTATWDCWKPMLHNNSTEASSGMMLEDVLSNDAIKKWEARGDGQALLVENIWNERFELTRVFPPGTDESSIIVHASPMI